MEIMNVNMSALLAATKFTANDKGRPMLNGVVVFANDLMLATNSYVAGVFGRPDEAPHNLAKRARAAMLAYREDREALVIGAKDVVAASKLRRSADEWPSWDIVQLDEQNVRFDYRPGGTKGVGVSQSLTVPLIEGEFPMLDGYMPSDPPQGAVYGTSLNTLYLKAICDAAVALTGKREAPLTLLGMWGASHLCERMRTQYWYVSSSSGSMLVVQMPMRQDHVTWAAEDGAAALTVA